MKITSPYFTKHVDKDILFYSITSLFLKYSRLAQSPYYVVENQENNRGKRNCYFILRSYKICRASPSLRLLETISLERKKGKSPLTRIYDVERLKLFEATLASTKVFRCRKYLAQTYQSSARQKYGRTTAPTEHKTVGCHLEKCLIRDDATLNR